MRPCAAAFVNVFLAVFVCVLLFTSTAQGLGNKWTATDPRCQVGGSGGSTYRLKRSVTSNNYGPGNYYRFDMNRGSCIKQFGNPSKDSNLFLSVGECDRACRNIWHF